MLFVLAAAGFFVGRACLRRGPRTVCMIVCGIAAAASAAYMLLTLILVGGIQEKTMLRCSIGELTGTADSAVPVIAQLPFVC